VLLRYSIYVCPLSSTRGAVGSGGSVARRVEKQEGGEKCRFSWAYRDLRMLRKEGRAVYVSLVV